MYARDRHNGQRDKRTNERTDGRTKRRVASLRPSIRPSLRWSLTHSIQSGPKKQATTKLSKNVENRIKVRPWD